MQHHSKITEIATRLTRFSADQGMLVKAGWQGYKSGVLPPHSPEFFHDECRLAFYAGALHLFASMMTIMDEDREPTEADLTKVTQINRELEDFAKVLETRIANITKIKGSA